jgi:hypothetical protein
MIRIEEAPGSPAGSVNRRNEALGIMWSGGAVAISSHKNSCAPSLVMQTGCFVRVSRRPFASVRCSSRNVLVKSSVGVLGPTPAGCAESRRNVYVTNPRWP